MTLRDYTANVISATKVVPDGNFRDSKASGVWDINEALDLIKGGNWPNAANFNPSAFVDGLFQTHVFDTTGAELSIDNGIDLSNKGGLVWLKSRSNATDHELFDTERGVNKILYSNANTASTSASLSLTSFNTNGFTLNNNLLANVNNRESVSWTFRKQPRFFDVVTYTGNGTAGKTVSHNLGSVPGMIIVKKTSDTEFWYVAHRSINADEVVYLNSTSAKATQSAYFNGDRPTDSVFTLGNSTATNGNGDTYVAYLFAHNADSTDSVQTSLQGKTLSNLGSAFDGSYPITKINDGVAETSNANSIGYVSNADMDISVDYGSAVVANAYYIAPQGDQGGSVYNTPTAFTAYGSNDGSSWTSLASFSSISGFAAGSFKEFTFSNTTAYRYYRLEITASSASGVSISEWELGLTPDASELGNFGEPGDSNIIKCGGYTGNGSTDGTEVNLGFEPQWLIIKATSVARDWHIFDAIRGTAVGGNDSLLQANLGDAESSGTEFVSFTPTGFKLNSTDNKVNGSNHTYIFMAIRRGGMQTPTSASDVFKATAMSSSFLANTGFAVDLSIDTVRTSTGSNFVNDRLRGSGVFMKTDATSAESTGGSRKFDSNQGVLFETGDSSGFTGVNWAWKRARGYFDMVAYTGTGSARTVTHNLGAAPEMIWTKRRSDLSNWMVYHSALGNTKALYLDSTATSYTSANWWNNTSPTSSVFTVGTDSWVNYSGSTYIAYLFATVAGVSKVGSYTGDGNTGKQIDCGFTSGASFIMIKRADSTGNWFVWDSARGIISGNDPYLIFNDTDAEVTSGDNVDPHDAGFIVNGPGNNVDGATHIFYAIAATS